MKMRPLPDVVKSMPSFLGWGNYTVRIFNKCVPKGHTIAPVLTGWFSSQVFSAKRVTFVCQVRSTFAGYGVVGDKLNLARFVEPGGRNPQSLNQPRPIVYLGGRAGQDDHLAFVKRRLHALNYAGWKRERRLRDEARINNCQPLAL